MISWLSKQSMIIVMFLKLARMLLLGNGVRNWESRIRKSKTIRSRKWNYLMKRLNAWTMRVSSGLFLTSASMISCLSKQSMVIVMFLVVLVRMLLLGNGVVTWDGRTRRCKTIRSQEQHYQMNRFSAWTMRVSSGVCKRLVSVVCMSVFAYGLASLLLSCPVCWTELILT